MNLIKINDYTKYINYLLIAYAFSIPLSKATTNITEALLLFLWIFSSNWKEKWKLYKHNSVSFFLIIFLTYSVISIIWANNFSFAVSYVLKYRHFLIILIFYTYLDYKYINKVLSAFLLAMLISEIMSYGIFFELWHYKNVLPSDPAPFMDHISYSAFLSITGAILLAKLIYEKENKLLLLAYMLFFTTLTLNIFINAGRTGQIMYIISLFIVIISLFKNKLKAFLSTTILVTLILTTAYNYSPNFSQRIAAFHTDINNAIEKQDFQGSLTIRVSLWMIGVDQIIDTMPIIGEGIGSDMKKAFYYVDKNPYLSRKHFAMQGDHHNMFITITIIYGFVGLFFILMLFYSIFKIRFKSKFYTSINIAFITGFTLWCMTGNNFHGMNPMTYFAFFTGYFNAVSKLEMTI